MPLLLGRGLGLGLQFGQSHFPDGGASVTRAHSQWYHPTGQVPLSHQIQSSDASGVPQVHLYFVASSSGDGVVGGGGGFSGSRVEGGEVCCAGEAG